MLYNLFSPDVACVAGAKRGGGGEREKGKREGRAPQSPLLFPFLPIPHPLPLSTPATQASPDGKPLVNKVIVAVVVAL